MNLPILQLLLKLNLNEKLHFINNLTKFFNLNDECNESLLKKFDFIHFSNNQIDDSFQLFDSSISNIQSYSLILFTVNNTYSVNGDNEVSVDTDLKYHHKVELKDEREKVVARQVFYELNNYLPLFCKTNWLPSNPSLDSSKAKNNYKNVKIESKYILRLNINCKNYDLMLMFYRLLFDKYPNYTKKHFSVFILKSRLNGREDEGEEEEEDDDSNIEFQLSLKFDPNLKPYALNNKVNLVYCVKSRELFENVVSLLSDLIKEVVPNRIYTIYDPDGNQIHLIDASSDSHISVNYLNTTCFSSYFNQNISNTQVSSSLTSLSSNITTQPKKSYLANHSPSDSYFSNLSPNSNSSSVHTPTNSTTSTNNLQNNLMSIDSGKDSGRCSTVSFSNDNGLKTSSNDHMKKYKIENSDASSSGGDSSTSVRDLIKKFTIEQLKQSNKLKKKTEFSVPYNNVKVKAHYSTSLVDANNLSEMRRKFYENSNIEEKRPKSSLGQPFHNNFNERSQRLERPKSCTQFNNHYLFSDAQMGKNFNYKKNSIPSNCFKANKNDKKQVNDNYSSNSSFSGKY